MLSVDEYVSADATEWAARVRTGDVSARDLAEAAIARAEAVNPKINAIAQKLYDRALADANALTGVFAGVPFPLKDMYQTIAGVPVTNGSRAFAGNLGQADGELVKRYRAAGLNIFCVSTSPELGLAAATESTLYGVTRNPWDLDRTSGGSSGGASALVAAGVAPFAHATDGGGSIRGPASCCGLFGLKPSRARTPIAPGRTEGWFGNSVTHAVTRSVRDSALLLDVSHGPEPGSRYVAPPPKGTFAQAAGRAPGRLRIAFHDRGRWGVTPHPECRAALEDAAKLCADLGHDVEEVAPPVNFDQLGIAFGVSVIVAVLNAVEARASALGRPIDDLLEQTTREYCAYARQLSAQHLMAANDVFMASAIEMATFQEIYDVILTPTMGQPPISVGAGALMQPSSEYDRVTTAFSCYTWVYNTTGQPAMSVPLYWSKDGLPIGAQFAGRVGEEELLFSLAAQLEEARPWFHRRPAL